MWNQQDVDTIYKMYITCGIVLVDVDSNAVSLLSLKSQLLWFGPGMGAFEFGYEQFCKQ